MTRLSVGEKRWRFPMAARAWLMALDSNWGAREENTSTLAYRESQRSAAVD
jgi:hypothetical protein